MAESGNNDPFYNSAYRHGVDEKRRIQIPAKWRNGRAEVDFMLILWPNAGQPDACLLVLPPKVARSLVEKLTAMPFGDPKAEALRRFLGEKSDMVTCDKTGRITLPESMSRTVGIEKEAVLTGMFDRFQIWNPDRYDATRPAVDALAPEAFKLI
jgi:MraZ protein